MQYFNYIGTVYSPLAGHLDDKCKVHKGVILCLCALLLEHTFDLFSISFVNFTDFQYTVLLYTESLEIHSTQV